MGRVRFERSEENFMDPMRHIHNTERSRGEGEKGKKTVERGEKGGERIHID